MRGLASSDRSALFAALCVIVAVGPADAQTKIKGIRPEQAALGYTDTQEVLSSGHPERVGLVFDWRFWEPGTAANIPMTPPCPTGFTEYSGHCFQVAGVADTGPRTIDDVVREYSAANVSVTGILFGTPRWAAKTSCSQYWADCSFQGPNHHCEGAQSWCAPNNPDDFARFARFLANRYNGTHGVGKVDSFQIQNEVNSANWYDIGCTGPHGSFATCWSDTNWLNTWVQSYANVYNKAYDAIVAEQPSAHVLISVTQYFAQTQTATAQRTFDEVTPSYTTVTAFTGNTQDNQWLTQSYSPAKLGVRYIYVSTTAGPAWVAWRELQAFAGNATNLAQGKLVAASSNQPEAFKAVDGSTTTSWNSGAPPPQNIGIDLGGPYSISQIKFLTNQNPSGTTTHQVAFGTTQYTINYPHIPSKQFLSLLIPLINTPSTPRNWRVAMHPYNSVSGSFSPENYPWITMGDIGAFSGWIYQTYGNVSAATGVHLTESGYPTDGTPASEALQQQLVCDSLWNALGTPGIVSYLYFPLPDDSSFQYGLWRANKSHKPAWTTWGNANVFPQTCGFDRLPYTQLDRYYNPTTAKHWQSSRKPGPPGFALEGILAFLRREPAAGTVLLYECRVQNSVRNFITTSSNCGVNRPMGPVGYVYTTQVAGTTPLVRCSVQGNDQFVATGANGCGNFTFETTLGYALVP